MNADPIRLTTKASNNRLKTIREQMKFTQKEMAEFCGVPYHRYTQAETLREFPPAEIAQQIAEALGESVEFIFPDYLKSVSTTVSISTVPEVQILSLADREVRQLPAQSESHLSEDDIRDLQKALKECLGTLTHREEKVLTLRFGLDGHGERTFSEIAEIFGLSVERIRQNCLRGLRKLRHPNRTRLLRGFLENE